MSWVQAQSALPSASAQPLPPTPTPAVKSQALNPTDDGFNTYAVRE